MTTHAAELERYRAQNKKSHEMYERAEKVLPLGVSSNFRTYEPYPIYIQRAQGSKMWDVDGREYTDFSMSFGALMVGHAQPGHGGGPRQGGRRGHALRHAPRPRGQGGGAPLPALPPRPDPLHELGLRVHDARAASRPRLHRPQQGPEVRRGLPRRPRRGARVREAAAAQGRPRPAPQAAPRGPRHPRRSVENTLVAQWNDLESVREILQSATRTRWRPSSWSR